MGRLVDTKEAAERLCVSRDTLTAWRRDKVGPPWIKYGTSDTNKVVYDEDDLTKFIEAMKRGSTVMPLDPNPDEVF